MKKILWIGLAGALGAILRTAIGEWMPLVSGFPVGTLTANLVGTFFLCLLMSGAFKKMRVKKEVQDVMTGGFLGAFTTFSSVSIETVLLVENGQGILAMTYIVLSILGGLSVGVFGNYLGGKLVKS